MRYTCQFTVFGKKVHMFREGNMGIVIEKEPHVVCVYGTDENFHILCAIPLCHPKFLRGAVYTIEFDEKGFAKVSVGQIAIMVDFVNKQCANNKGIKCYGSDDWGRDIQIEWKTV